MFVAVRVTPAQVYNVKSTAAKPKLNGYASLNQAKKPADTLGVMEKASVCANPTFLAYLRLAHGPDDSVKFTVLLRGVTVSR